MRGGHAGAVDLANHGHLQRRACWSDVEFPGVHIGRDQHDYELTVDPVLDALPRLRGVSGGQGAVGEHRINVDQRLVDVTVDSLYDLALTNEEVRVARSTCDDRCSGQRLIAQQGGHRRRRVGGHLIHGERGIARRRVVEGHAAGAWSIGTATGEREGRGVRRGVRLEGAWGISESVLERPSP